MEGGSSNFGWLPGTRDGNLVEYTVGSGPAAPKSARDDAAQILRRGLREMYRRNPESYPGRLEVLCALGLPEHLVYTPTELREERGT